MPPSLDPRGSCWPAHRSAAGVDHQHVTSRVCGSSLRAASLVATGLPRSSTPTPPHTVPPTVLPRDPGSPLTSRAPDRAPRPDRAPDCIMGPAQRQSRAPEHPREINQDADPRGGTAFAGGAGEARCLLPGVQENERWLLARDRVCVLSSPSRPWLQRLHSGADSTATTRQIAASACASSRLVSARHSTCSPMASSWT